VTLLFVETETMMMIVSLLWALVSCKIEEVKVVERLVVVWEHGVSL
jgi:hypothetical protein